MRLFWGRIGHQGSLSLHLNRVKAKESPAIEVDQV